MHYFLMNTPNRNSNCKKQPIALIYNIDPNIFSLGMLHPIIQFFGRLVGAANIRSEPCVLHRTANRQQYTLLVPEEAAPLCSTRWVYIYWGKQCGQDPLLQQNPRVQLPDWPDCQPLEALRQFIEELWLLGTVPQKLDPLQRLPD